MDRERLSYGNWEHHQRKHGSMRRSRTEWRDGRPRSRSRSKGRKSRERRRSKSRDKRERSSKSMERSSKSMERSSKTPDPRFGDMERFDKFEGMSEEERIEMVRAKAEAELLANTEPQPKEPSVDKKEEARQKLKDLISKNKERTKEVKEKDKKPKKEIKEKKDKEKKSKKHKVKEDGDSEQEKVREKREREQERAEREKESDGDWHCGDEHCRFVNFKRNAECKKCRRPQPDTAVFWDLPASPERRPKSKERSGNDRKVRSSKATSLPLNEAVLEEDEHACASPEMDIGLKFDSEEGRSSRSSRPSSRSGHVTSFLDDIGDFEPEPIKDNIGEERRVYLQSDTDDADKVTQSKTMSERSSADTQLDEVPEKEASVACKVGAEMSFETISSQSIMGNSIEEEKEITKDEAIHENQEDENEDDCKKAKDEVKDDVKEGVDDPSETSKSEPESAFDGSKKHKWSDLGRRSDEFELHLDINDAEFVDTVKAEYRSSSPSWADCKKFKYPGGGEEKAVSVRKRMEDEIKKDDVEATPKAETVKGRRRSGEEERCEEEQLKIRGGEVGLWKERPYRRSSKDDLVEVFERERREGSSASEGERERRDMRQRERDRKDRDRNNRMREEDEERKRRAKLEDARESNEKWVRKRREEEHNTSKKERELKEKKKLEDRKLAEEDGRRRREEEDLMRRQNMLREEKKKLDAEKRAIIDRKRASDERRSREKLAEEKESRKRNRSGSGESSGSKKKVVADLRSQLDRKKEKSVITKKKAKSKSKKKKKRESSSSESSSESNNSSESESDSDSDIALKVFQDKKMLKKLLEAVAKNSKKKKSKKKKKKSVKKVAPEQRRVVLAREGGSITMQLSNTSQEEEDDEMEAELAKYNRKANKILKRSSTDEESEEKQRKSKEEDEDDDDDPERIEINIRNSPAFKRLNKKKKQKKKKDSSSDESDSSGGAGQEGDSMEEGELESE